MQTILLTCRHIISALLLALYLLLPAQGMVHAAVSVSDNSVVQSDHAKTSDSSCPDCPCNDGRDSGCCDSSFCSCSYHAPTSAHLQQIYAPMITVDRLHEPHWSLPQVYGSIYVPPQNPA